MGELSGIVGVGPFWLFRSVVLSSKVLSFSIQVRSVNLTSCSSTLLLEKLCALVSV